MPSKKKKVTRRRPIASNTPPMVIHWEIQALDAKGLQAFYQGLFGWKIDASNAMAYGMVDSKGANGKGGIDGGIGGSMTGKSRMLVYAEVPDIDVVLRKAESLGGTTVMPRTDVGPVLLAIVEDIEGNHFGVIERSKKKGK